MDKYGIWRDVLNKKISELRLRFKTETGNGLKHVNEWVL